MKFSYATENQYVFIEDIIKGEMIKEELVKDSQNLDQDILKISVIEKKKPSKINIENFKIKKFSAENAPLKSVLYGIFQGTNLSVVFDPDVDVSKSITVDFKETSLAKALNAISDIAKVGFELDDNIVKVKPTIVKMFKLPYIKSVSSFNTTLGGNITGGSGRGTGGTGGAGGTGGTGGASGQMGFTGNFELSYTGNEDVYDIYTQIEENIKNLLSEKGKLTINKMTGLITVEDYPHRINLVEKYLSNIKKEIDKQVLIEAKIVEVSLSDSYQFGIDWNFLLRNVLNSRVTYSQTLALPGSTANLTVTSSSINALINAVANYGEVNTLANPRLLVTNNQTALISSGKIIPFWNKQINIVGGTATTQPYSTVTYTRRDILDGILLGLTTHIEDDGDITINIVPIASKLIGTRQLLEGNTVVAEAPILNVKESGTVVKVKDNDTIIIGGLISKDENTTETKVPLLGDIPVLGNLFKQKSKSKEVRELVIFMRVVKIDRNTPY
jgi:MSHA biogenesis protein MshL